MLLIFVGAPATRRTRHALAPADQRAARAAGQELERNREARARAARLATRASIARELHDIIAHEVSVMVVQAQAARRSVERGRDDASSSIEVIETTGREALTQMRRLLGVLRHEDDGAALAPQPIAAPPVRARRAGARARPRRAARRGGHHRRAAAAAST